MAKIDKNKKVEQYESTIQELHRKTFGRSMNPYEQAMFNEFISTVYTENG